MRRIPMTSDDGLVFYIEVPEQVMDAIERSQTLGTDLCVELSGYPEAELRGAFEFVQDEEHWKNPIRKIVPAAGLDRKLVAAAIEHYHGAAPAFLDAPNGMVIICSAGYAC